MKMTLTDKVTANLSLKNIRVVSVTQSEASKRRTFQVKYAFLKSGDAATYPPRFVSASSRADFRRKVVDAACKVCMDIDQNVPQHLKNVERQVGFLKRKRLPATDVEEDTAPPSPKEKLGKKNKPSVEDSKSPTKKTFPSLKRKALKSPIKITKGLQAKARARQAPAAAATKLPTWKQCDQIIKCCNQAILNDDFSRIYHKEVMKSHSSDGDDVVEELSAKQQLQLQKKAIALRAYYETIKKWRSEVDQGTKHSPRGAVEAAILAAQETKVGYHRRQLFKIIKKFTEDGFWLRASQQGRHERRWIVVNAAWGKVCRDYIRENAAVKGQPNMTVDDFRAFVNANVISKVRDAAARAKHEKLKAKFGLSERTLEKGIGRGTARMWLHHLGCTFKGQGKDVYYDGHERDDVVKYRKEFLARLKKYQDDTDTVVVYQDEVVYRSHECQNMYWHLPEDASNGEPVNVVLRRKGGGKGLMLSGFVTREQGFSYLTDDELVAVNRSRVERGLDQTGYASKDCWNRWANKALHVANL